MKKFLLAIAVASALCGNAVAQEKLVYAPANDAVSNIGFQTGNVMYSAAVKISGESAKALKGSKLTTVSVCMGSMTNKTAEVFITHDLNAEYDYTQEYRGSVNQYKDIVLDTPYECDGEDFYIGYNYLCSSARDWPISIDGNMANPFPGWFYLAAWENQSNAPAKKSVLRKKIAFEAAAEETEEEGEDEEEGNGIPYQDYGSELGNLCIRATFEGENLPTALVYPYSIVEPPYAEPNKPFSFPMTISNMGASAINNLEISYTNAKGETETQEVTLDTPVEIGTFGEINIDGIVFGEESPSVNLNVAVTKVNGAENVLADLAIATDFESVNNPFPRKLVVEEFTGVDCGYCPMGYAGMEYMHETYPDDVILLAAHNFSYPSDPMKCESYIPWSNTYIKGAPQATINRIKLGDSSQYTTGYTCSASKDELIAFYNLYANRPCIAKVDVEGTYTEGNENEVTMIVKTTFKKSLSNHYYALAFAVTEDNLGPYRQENYYAGGRLGECEGFEDKPSKVSLMYNDVARNIWNWTGLDGSIPSNIEADKEMEYTFKMDVSNVTNHKNATIIAILIDRSNGEIVTGGKNSIRDAKETNHVVELNGGYAVSATNGMLSVSGEFNNATVYSINGVKMASMTEAGSINLPAGIYAVSVEKDGEIKVIKTIVK